MTRLFMWPHMVQFVPQISELVGPDLVSRKWRSHMLAHTYVAGNWRSATRVGRSWWRATVACLQFRRELDTQNQSSVGNVVKKNCCPVTLLCLMSLGCCLKMFDYAINFFTVNIWVDIMVGWMNSSGRLMSPKAAPQHIAPTGCRQPTSLGKGQGLDKFFPNALMVLHVIVQYVAWFG